MAKSDEAVRGGEALRERITTLVAAILRISASLDVGTVLREVVDGARALTGARYGIITPVDEACVRTDATPMPYYASSGRAMR